MKVSMWQTRIEDFLGRKFFKNLSKYQKWQRKIDDGDAAMSMEIRRLEHQYGGGKRRNSSKIRLRVETIGN